MFGSVMICRTPHCATWNKGGTVLLVPEEGTIAGDIPSGFPPVFWNTLWFPSQRLRTLGLLCNPAHPALAEFPTEFHSNWQWWELIHSAQNMVLDGMPRELRPIIQVIDDWNTSRKLGLAFEARVGQGKLLVCSIDIVSNLSTRPAARQLRYSLQEYVKSTDFNPHVAITREQLASLFKK